MWPNTFPVYLEQWKLFSNKFNADEDVGHFIDRNPGAFVSPLVEQLLMDKRIDRRYRHKRNVALLNIGDLPIYEGGNSVLTSTNTLPQASLVYVRGWGNVIGTEMGKFDEVKVNYSNFNVPKLQTILKYKGLGTIIYNK